MKTTVHSLPPSQACPFHVDAVQYLPEQPYKKGFTLVFFHAMNTHKEQFETAIGYLLQQPHRIRDVWCIENPNHGSSAVKNRALLDTPEYRDKCTLLIEGFWTSMEYSRAAHTFLTSTSHGIDFGSRNLVGLAHSAGSASLFLLQQIQPPIPFHALILMDAAILPIGTPGTRVLTRLFGTWAKTKPNTWSDRAAAHAELSKTAFRRWHPSAVDLFVKHAIGPVDERVPEGAVTLRCSTRQEVAFFLGPTADLVDTPTEIFLHLTKEDKLPIHSLRMTQGSVQIVEGGHMFPQTEPAGCARAIAQALERVWTQLQTRGVEVNSVSRL
ncbi:hypothetical protein FB45DRAFT_1046386 [Roridomyces roridus]|uniref:AB hydrolase-1 domain-containing protein n=1 Tax=Roridomyces roridus TaxID=1738132 RepID=A0AAD7AXZ5_9AGAR|nr:hypothetical protein FB45DRAFT_1046386 [Roridomyces roridus]